MPELQPLTFAILQYLDIKTHVVAPYDRDYIEVVADKLAKYFSGHLAAFWHTFGCNFMGSVHLKLPEKVSRHLVVFSVGRVTSKTKIFIKNLKINYTRCMPIYIIGLLSEPVTQTTTT